MLVKKQLALRMGRETLDTVEKAKNATLQENTVEQLHIYNKHSFTEEKKQPCL